MKRYEYDMVAEGPKRWSVDDVKRTLRSRGESGWRLAGMWGDWFIFERPLTNLSCMPACGHTRSCAVHSGPTHLPGACTCDGDPPVTPQEEEAMREKMAASLEEDVEYAYKRFETLRLTTSDPFAFRRIASLLVSKALEREVSLATVLADLSSLGEAQLCTVAESCKSRLAARAAAKEMR